MSLIVERPIDARLARLPWPPGLHPVLRQVYARRPISAIEDLDLSLRRLPPVGDFTALGPAVELVMKHRHSEIVIVGDYDSDGATSAALMVLALRALGIHRVIYFVPDRFELGYGLSVGAVEQIRRKHSPGLLITVDNGISSVAGVTAARTAGIDVLVTDHHLPPERLPDANVIVDPNLPSQRFADGNLAGVGVAFYLLAALGKALGQPTRVAEYLDLVALGTVADLVQLDNANRILVSEGLRRIRAGHCRPGIAALCEQAGVALAAVDSGTLGYQIGPRLNAAGRLEDMSIGVQCLIADSGDEARRLAQRLDALNRERRDLEAKMRAEALTLAEEFDGKLEQQPASVLCLYSEDWHEGLVGLIASRIKERYHRPVIAFAPSTDGLLKGSGRSIAGFHIRDALAEVDARFPGLITRFGGHAMAAGLTIGRESLEALQSELSAVAQRLLGSDALTRTVMTDGQLDAEHFELDAAIAIREAGPWGQGFPEPTFDGYFDVAEVRWLKDVHLKLSLRHSGRVKPIDAIAFNCANREIGVDQNLRAAFRLSVNDFYSSPRLQLIIDHVEPQ